MPKRFFSAVLLVLLQSAPALAETQSATSSPPLGGISLIVGIIAFVRRKHAIGGWLLYFFIQLYAGTAFSITSLVTGLVGYNRTERYAWYLLSTVPDTLALLAISGVCAALLWTRDWRWIVPVRAALGLRIGVGIVSVAIDVAQFPASVPVSIASLIFPSVLLAYFCVSTRVQEVFKTHDWEVRHGAPVPNFRDLAPKKGITYTASELEAMSDRRSRE